MASRSRERIRSRTSRRSCATCGTRRRRCTIRRCPSRRRPSGSTSARIAIITATSMGRASRKPPSRGSIRSSISAAAAISLAVVAFALYANALAAPFVFDDDYAIVVNEQIRHISTSLSPTERGSPLAGRPLVSLTFAVNYALGGLDPRGYRLVNIAIHVVNALLLFEVVGRALTARQNEKAPRAAAPHTTAFPIAVMWMVHPLASEPIDYVSQRTELMMATFFLATLYCRGWASVLCCALGMACKETMVVAPIVVMLHDRVLGLRQQPRHYAALCATWLILIALLWSSPRGDSAGFAGASVSPWEYLLNQSAMIVRYLRLAFWPRDLVLDYGEPTHVTFQQVAPEFFIVAALLAATAVAFVRRPPLGFLGAWFFLTLAPTSSSMTTSTEVG